MEIPLPLHETAPRHRRIMLTQMHMHRGVRKVHETPGMIRIQMGHDDMPNVLGIETQRLNLCPRCIRQIEPHRKLPLIRLWQS